MKRPRKPRKHTEICLNLQESSPSETEAHINKTLAGKARGSPGKSQEMQEMTQETQETYRESAKPLKHTIQVKLKPMLSTENPGK
jgi:hypothetical protein